MTISSIEENSTLRRRVVLLDPSVAERIAAGEVVERPASIVKELVENALDAGATRIFVEIADGGQRSITVTDDGCGMPREDAILALSRFATSKIRAWEDMEALDTLGFRGEALPSILAVSRLEMLTREPDAPVGTRLVGRGSEILETTDAGCPAGTSITITDLFYNTPARKKFLKSGTAEAARIIDMLGRLSLVRADVHFHLVSQGREVFNFPTQYEAVDRAVRLWGMENGTPLVSVQGQGRGTAVRALVALPPHYCATRMRQVFFVNGRLIGQSALNHAVAQGFAPLVPDRRFPIAVVFVDVAPDLVDVNIHPTKAEVRFLHPGEVFRVVRDTVADALAQHGAGPLDAAEAVRQVARTEAQPRHAPSWIRDERPLRPSKAQVDAALEAMQPLLPTAHDAPYMPPAPVARVTRPSASRWQVLAQLDRTYIVCLRGDDLWIVDQHTAHERVNYEALAHLTDDVKPASQPLLFPTLLDLAPAEAQALHDHLDVFESLGYHVEPFGGTTFVVRALPAGMEALSKPESMRHIIHEIAQDGCSKEPARLRELLRATTACRASVMAGDVLTIDEMQILLERLEHVEHAGYCPHGRPVSVRLDADALARLFHRK